METQERLYRSTNDKVIGGVAGGLADYFNIDVVLARVIFVLLALFGGGGVLIYIVMWIIIPEQDKLMDSFNSNYSKSEEPDGDSTTSQSETPIADEIIRSRNSKTSNTGLIAGIILIFAGLLFLGDRLLPWYNITDLWPLLLVVVGVLLIKPDIFKPTKKQTNEI